VRVTVRENAAHVERQASVSLTSWGASARMKPMSLRYAIEASVVRLGFALFRALPLDVASSLGGSTARRIGPLLSISRGAERRLRRALPEIDAQEGRRVIAGMWENLGRGVAESPHLGDFDIHAPGGRVTIIGGDYIRQLRDDGVGCIFFSAHFGNWELLPIIAGQSGIPLTYVYREANNPAVEAIFRKARVSHPGRCLIRRRWRNNA
jgi:Kdo2-lipid IVA lauroyltransferase/acyltransferase